MKNGYDMKKSMTFVLKSLLFGRKAANYDAVTESALVQFLNIIINHYPLYNSHNSLFVFYTYFLYITISASELRLSVVVRV